MYKDLKPYTTLNITGKTVAIVANLDVPIKDGELMDSTKIKAIIPTIQYFQKKQNKIIILSSLGPKSGEYDDAFSMMPVRFEISRELEKPVKFVSIVTSMNSIKFMEMGDVLVFENLNFNKEFFSKKSAERSKFIAGVKEFVDYVIFDGPGLDENLAHSNELLKDKEVLMGEAVINEIKAIERIQTIESSKPLTVVIGGKLNDNKINFLKLIVDKADKILLGGSTAYDFMSFKKIKIGDSDTSDSDYSKKIEQIYKIASKSNCEIIMPIDHIVTDKDDKYGDLDTQEIKKGFKGVDIGPKTLTVYREIIESSHSIIWNGPVGIFENEESNRGTESIGEYIALSAPKNAFKLTFGDSTSLALKQLKVKHKRFSHISVAGDAFVNYLLG